ncbi:MAG: hypothetical protein ACE5NC_09420 [Anaerolineae bacterium]
MSEGHTHPSEEKAIHPWLKSLRVAFVPGQMSPLLEEVADGLLRHFQLLGHDTQATPDDSTDLFLTTAPFGEPIPWRKALIFNLRKRFGTRGAPSIETLVHVTPDRFRALLDHFEQALAKEGPDPDDYEFPGLARKAPRVLYNLGRRGGAIVALERLVQAQAMSLRVLLVVGDGRPSEAYHFDLVGAHPKSEADDLEAFYRDIVLRIVTTESTVDVKEHELVGDRVAREVWEGLSTPTEMISAARQLGKRNFFTDMVRISDVVQVPAVPESIANQYSEGCFATWDPRLHALIATVTGSARPVHKGGIGEDDLAVIVGVRPDGGGAQVRHVEGKRNDPPSTEAVEMIDIDSALPTITLDDDSVENGALPVIRSKLHGHRGISAYDPSHVEFVELEPAYYHYLVSCATEAQARGIKEAFARSESLTDPGDARQVAFTVLPGHGVFMVEKWVSGTAPFQTLWEYMDAGYLKVVNRVPQGPMRYVPGPSGQSILDTS